MKESKVIEEFQEEARVETRGEDILRVLEARFGRRAAAEFAPVLKNVAKSSELDKLLRLAARSEGLQQFRDRLPAI